MLPAPVFFRVEEQAPFGHQQPMIFLPLASLLFAAQPAQPATPIEAATVAAAIQPRLPQRFSPEVAMVGAAAEGNLLVLTFEFPEPMLAGATPESVSARWSQGFCTLDAGRALLEGPMTLRIDARTPQGRSLRGAVLDACPRGNSAG